MEEDAVKTKEIAVLIGDLVRSRKAKDRAEVQRKLRKIVDEINGSAKSIIAPLAVARGDEFEGAFKDAAACYAAFERIERALYPVKVQAGIGIGGINTDFSKNVTEMDGSAFHHAREALERVRGSGSGTLVAKDGKSEEDVNVMLSMFWALKNGWTDRQRELAEFYLDSGMPMQIEVAKHFGVSQPAVAKVLSAANVASLTVANKIILRKLSELIDEGGA